MHPPGNSNVINHVAPTWMYTGREQDPRRVQYVNQKLELF